jgi:hypothetical protein
MTFDEKHYSLANHVLIVSLLTALQQKGVLNSNEIVEVLEQSLLNLETHQNAAGPKGREAFEGARGLLELLRSGLSAG